MEEEKCRTTPSLHTFGIDALGLRGDENDLTDQDRARSGQGSCWYRILPFVTDIHHRLVERSRELIYDLEVEPRPNTCLLGKGRTRWAGMAEKTVTGSESGEKVVANDPTFRIAPTTRLSKINGVSKSRKSYERPIFGYRETPAYGFEEVGL